MKARSRVWVYVLRCADGTLYTGTARDVQARLSLHMAGKGAKYTRGRAPLSLKASAACPTRSCALRAEHVLKRLSKPAKERLVAKPRAFRAFVRRAWEGLDIGG